MSARLSVAVLALVVAGQVWPATSHADDEPWLLSVDTQIAVPVGSSTGDLFGPGITGAVSLQRGIVPWFVAGLRVRAALLTNGSPPADVGQVDPGIGTLYSAVLAGRFRPLGKRDDPRRAIGLWLDVGAGIAVTGDLVRATLETGAGWGFPVAKTAIGPVVRFVQVIQGDNALDSSDARILSFGVELSFLDAELVLPAEEEDDWLEEDGDRDGDSIPDAEDECPDQPEDFDEFADVDGCPDDDNDGDGILDGRDECSMIPEDPDGYEDADGCPDEDNDGDGLPDERDHCPDQPETVNGVNDHDGCPDEGLISFVDDRIVLEEQVLFDTERARIKRRALPVIRAIVSLWRQHPEWTRIRIEGHADARGPEDYNLRLSLLRAQRVRDALIEEGLPADIVEYAGLGSSRPIDPGRTEAAHQRNRRVEFIVVARGAPVTVPDPQSTETVDVPEAVEDVGDSDDLPAEETSQ